MSSSKNNINNNNNNNNHNNNINKKQTVSGVITKKHTVTQQPSTTTQNSIAQPTPPRTKNSIIIKNVTPVSKNNNNNTPTTTTITTATDTASTAINNNNNNTSNNTNVNANNNNNSLLNNNKSLRSKLSTSPTITSAVSNAATTQLPTSVVLIEPPSPIKVKTIDKDIKDLLLKLDLLNYQSILENENITCWDQFLELKDEHLKMMNFKIGDIINIRRFLKTTSAIKDDHIINNYNNSNNNGNNGNNGDQTKFIQAFLRSDAFKIAVQKAFSGSSSDKEFNDSMSSFLSSSIDNNNKVNTDEEKNNNNKNVDTMDEIEHIKLPSSSEDEDDENSDADITRISVRDIVPPKQQQQDTLDDQPMEIDKKTPPTPSKSPRSSQQYETIINRSINYSSGSSSSESRSNSRGRSRSRSISNSVGGSVDGSQSDSNNVKRGRSTSRSANRSISRSKSRDNSSSADESGADTIVNSNNKSPLQFKKPTIINITKAKKKPTTKSLDKEDVETSDNKESNNEMKDDESDSESESDDDKSNDNIKKPTRTKEQRERANKKKRDKRKKEMEIDLEYYESRKKAGSAIDNNNNNNNSNSINGISLPDFSTSKVQMPQPLSSTSSSTALTTTTNNISPTLSSTPAKKQVDLEKIEDFISAKKIEWYEKNANRLNKMIGNLYTLAKNSEEVFKQRENRFFEYNAIKCRYFNEFQYDFSAQVFKTISQSFENFWQEEWIMDKLTSNTPPPVYKEPPKTKSTTSTSSSKSNGDQHVFIEDSDESPEDWGEDNVISKLSEQRDGGSDSSKEKEVKDKELKEKEIKEKEVKDKVKDKELKEKEIKDKEVKDKVVSPPPSQQDDDDLSGLFDIWKPSTNKRKKPSPSIGKAKVVSPPTQQSAPSPPPHLSQSEDEKMEDEEEEVEKEKGKGKVESVVEIEDEEEVEEEKVSSKRKKREKRRKVVISSDDDEKMKDEEELRINARRPRDLDAALKIKKKKKKSKKSKRSNDSDEEMKQDSENSGSEKDSNSDSNVNNNKKTTKTTTSTNKKNRIQEIEISSDSGSEREIQTRNGRTIRLKKNKSRKEAIAISSSGSSESEVEVENIRSTCSSSSSRSISSGSDNSDSSDTTKRRKNKRNNNRRKKRSNSSDEDYKYYCENSSDDDFIVDSSDISEEDDGIIEDSDDGGSGGEKYKEKIVKRKAEAEAKKRQVRLIDIKDINNVNKATLRIRKEEEEEVKQIEELRATRNLNSVKRDSLVVFPGNTQADDILLDPEIGCFLKEHQQKGVQFLWENMVYKNKGCILAHSMGLGKSLQVVSFVHTHNHYNKGTRYLLIVPANTLYNWEKEFKKWLPKGESTKPNGIRVFAAINQNLTKRIKTFEDWYKNGGVLALTFESFSSVVNKWVSDEKTNREQNIANGTNNVCPIASVDKLLETDFLIVDEGHRLKSNKTKISDATNKIKTPRKVLLTGYPLQNNLMEYYTMIDFIRPLHLGNEKEFRDRFVRPIEAGTKGDATPQTIKLMRGRLAALQSLIKDFVQRLGPEVLDREINVKKSEKMILVKRTDIQTKLLEISIKSSNFNDHFAQYEVLTVVGCHPDGLLEKKPLVTKDLEKKSIGELKSILVANDVPTADIIEKSELVKRVINLNEIKASDLLQPSVFSAYFNQIGYRRGIIERSNKFVLFFSMLKVFNEHSERVVAFSFSISTLNQMEYFIQKKLGWKLGVDYLRLDGATPPKTRQKLIDQYNDVENNVKLFIISTKAGSLGTNLTGGTRVIIMDLSWNPVHDRQAVYRCYRIGQKKQVYVYTLVMAGTGEQKTYTQMIYKQTLSKRAVDSETPKNVEEEVKVRNKELVDVLQDMASINHELQHGTDTVFNKVITENQSAIIAIKDVYAYFTMDEYGKLTEEEEKEAINDYKKEITINTGGSNTSTTTTSYPLSTKSPTFTGVLKFQ